MLMVVRSIFVGRLREIRMRVVVIRLHRVMRVLVIRHHGRLSADQLMRMRMAVFVRMGMFVSMRVRMGMHDISMLVFVLVLVLVLMHVVMRVFVLMLVFVVGGNGTVVLVVVCRILWIIHGGISGGAAYNYP